MEAVYEWIRQIAVFAVISYLVLYLMGSQDKKYSLRFYLSLLMLLLILKPAASVFHLDQILTDKLTELETDSDMTAVSGQIRKAAQSCDREFLDCISESVLSQVRELAEDKKLKLEKGTVNFDEKKLEQSGEVVITGMDFTVSGTGKQSSEIRALLGELKEEAAEAFELEKYAVSVKWKN